MELDELKNSWNTLAEKLQANEILNKRIIKDMILQRTDSSLSSLARYEKRGSIFLLIFGTILTYAMYCSHYAIILQVAVMLFFLITAVVTGLKAMFVIAVQKETSNIHLLEKKINQYRKYLIWEGILTVPIILLMLCLFVIFDKNSQSTFAITMYLVIALILVPLSAYIGYKLFYAVKLRELEKSTKELKEFEQD